jgi:hypothetical protein
MNSNYFEKDKLIAYCGLYCGNCSSLKKGKCPGCAKNRKATWCKIRICCIEKDISSCAACTDFDEVKECSKYKNVFAKVIEFVSQTDRSLCIEKIRNEGENSFVLFMEKEGKMSLPKEKKR